MIWDCAIWCHPWIIMYFLICEVLKAVNINNVILCMWPRAVWYMHSRQQVLQKVFSSLLIEIRNTSSRKTVTLKSFCLSRNSSHSIQSTLSHLTSLTSISILITTSKLSLLSEISILVFRWQLSTHFSSFTVRTTCAGHPFSTLFYCAWYMPCDDIGK